MDIKDIVKNIADCFEVFGPYIHISDDSYLPDMLSYIALHDKEKWERNYLDTEDMETEINFEEAMEDYCQINNIELVDWSIDQVFDSCGLDLFSLSFVLRLEDGTIVPSFHTIYERG